MATVALLRAYLFIEKWVSNRTCPLSGVVPQLPHFELNRIEQSFNFMCRHRRTIRHRILTEKLLWTELLICQY